MKKVFDYVVIIVANQFQKKFLERKLLERKEKLFNGTKYKIEIEKEKVGSGGALIKLVRQIKKDGKKILVINSAGKSSRMPLYADKGKICIPTFSGKNTILFDEILEETINIGENMNSGILVVSGDCTINYKEVNNKVFKENEETQRLIRRQAEHDAMTDALNRRSFEKLLHMYENGDTPYALILIDVDTFKTVNDMYGHAVGDEILKKVTGLLKKAFRSIDHVCRIGGDEFAIIMVEMTSDLKYTIEKKIKAVNEGRRMKISRQFH